MIAVIVIAFLLANIILRCDKGKRISKQINIKGYGQYKMRYK